eukprot:SAG22_NODE_5623_length_982_cov_1.575311_1_plen_60_part_10
MAMDLRCLLQEEYYVYMYCAPTRGAFHTGRFPYHEDAWNGNLIPWSLPQVGMGNLYIHFA